MTMPDGNKGNKACLWTGPVCLLHKGERERNDQKNMHGKKYLKVQVSRNSKGKKDEARWTKSRGKENTWCDKNEC